MQRLQVSPGIRCTVSEILWLKSSLLQVKYGASNVLTLYGEKGPAAPVSCIRTIVSKGSCESSKPGWFSSKNAKKAAVRATPACVSEALKKTVAGAARAWLVQRIVGTLAIFTVVNLIAVAFGLPALLPRRFLDAWGRRRVATCPKLWLADSGCLTLEAEPESADQNSGHVRNSPDRPLLDNDA